MPGLPVHKGIAKTLGDAPDDASRYERMRDRLLRLLSHNVFAYLAVLWAIALVGWFIFFALTFLNISGIAPLAREHYWNEKATQVLSGLFTYICSVPLPWRLANVAHLCAARSSRGAAGLDFYGRPTAAVWFNVPRRARVRLVVLLLLNSALQYVHQSLHFVYHTYDKITTMPGMLLLGLTMVGSAGCGIAAGVYQWRCEMRLRAAHPERYPPGPFELAAQLYERWRAGESLRGEPPSNHLHSRAQGQARASSRCPLDPVSSRDAARGATSELRQHLRPFCQDRCQDEQN
jgi:hypothetical protein